MGAGSGAFAAHVVRHGIKNAHKIRFQKASALFGVFRVKASQNALPRKTSAHKDHGFTLASGHTAAVVGKTGQNEFSDRLSLWKGGCRSIAHDVPHL